MRILVSAAALFAAFAPYSSAYALSVTNRDGTDQKLTITETGKEPRDETVAPNGVLSNICPQGCVIQLQNGEEYEFDGNEVVSIEEGLMFLDEPAQEENGDPATQKPSGSVNGAAPSTPPAQTQTPAAQTPTAQPPAGGQNSAAPQTPPAPPSQAIYTPANPATKK